MSRTSFAIFLVAFVTSSAYGRDLRVPEEFGSISMALLSLAVGDTVSLAPGVYVEALQAPPVTFTLRGTVRLDSQATEFSVIDPTNLPGSDTLRIMNMSGGTGFFRDIVFRNRSAMTEGRPSPNSGGIQGDTLVRLVSFERCVFDSVHGGIRRMNRIRLQDCRFIGSRSGAASGYLWVGRVDAYNTVFDGATGSLVSTNRGCDIRNCLFTHRGTLQMIVGNGDSLRIENCRFVALDTMIINAVQIRPRCGSVLRDCTFENIISRGNALWVTDSCFEQPKEWECALELINNRFVNCGSADSELQQGGEPIVVMCNELSHRGFLAVLDSNRIDSTHDVRGWSSGILLRASASIEYTIFGDELTTGKPQMAIIDRGVQDTVYMRLNSYSQDFDGTTFVTDGNSYVDARQNWWGHESGPYNANTNPAGQGARVADRIRYNPWLLFDPDTTQHGDTTEHADSPSELLPESYSLSAFPNPFNATTTLTIEVARAGEYEIRVVDVLGREAGVVYRRRLESGASVRLSGGEFPSGVYFAVLSRADEMLAVTKLLLLK